MFIANNYNVPREKTASDLAMPAIGISQVSTMVVCGKSFLLGFRTKVQANDDAKRNAAAPRCELAGRPLPPLPPLAHIMGLTWSLDLSSRRADREPGGREEMADATDSPRRAVTAAARHGRSQCTTIGDGLSEPSRRPWRQHAAAGGPFAIGNARVEYRGCSPDTPLTRRAGDEGSIPALIPR